jgi:hypothetical protein
MRGGTTRALLRLDSSVASDEKDKGLWDINDNVEYVAQTSRRFGYLSELHILSK